MIDPKEKADELFNHFYDNEFSVIGYIGKEDAKIQATYIVDEILKSFGLPSRGQQFYTSYSAVQFWETVKIFINDK